MSIGSEEREAVLRVLDRGILSGYQGNWSDNFYGGPEIKALEKEWAEYFGVKHAIACNSATSGLWMACAAIGLGYEEKEDSIAGEYFNYIQEDEVIVTPYSMTCSASIPLHLGAKPVFADIERDYYCLDPISVEKAITECTKAIIVVDLFGQPADYDEINRIAAKYSKKYGHKIYVIEDAAQAAGAKYKGKYAGTLGDIGVYSLNVHKPIQCGEGGIVTTNDDKLAFKLRLICNHAEAVVHGLSNSTNAEFWYEDYQGLVGMNLRMTEISAAIAREQLKKLEGILQVYREYAVKYFGVEIRPGCEHAYYRYAISCIQPEATKRAIELLNDFNVKQHYITPLFKLPLFKSLGYDQGQCLTCQAVEENIVLAWLKETP